MHRLFSSLVSMVGGRREWNNFMNNVMNFMNHGSGVDNLGVSGLALILDLHDCAPIMAVSTVCHILDAAVRKGNLGGQINVNLK